MIETSWKIPVSRKRKKTSKTSANLHLSRQKVDDSGSAEASRNKFYFRIPFLNKSDLKPMRALAENVFLDCMTKEPDFISYKHGLYCTGYAA